MRPSMPKKFDSIEQKKSGLSKKMYDLRKTWGCTQQEMAKHFCVTTSTIALWELGNRKVPGPVQKLIFIFEKIGKDASERFYLKEQQHGN